MTHPLTPREKVARMAAEAFHNGYQSYDQCDETMRMRFDWIADMIVGSPALASGSGSGSGDHAELIDRLRSRTDSIVETPLGPFRSSRGRSRNPDGPEAADALETLLAENAALRAEVSQANANGASHWSRATEAERALSEHRITADLLVSTLKADKAEVERRLTEAVGVLEKIAEHKPFGDGTEYRTDYQIGHDNAGSYAANLARSFLSKEAER